MNARINELMAKGRKLVLEPQVAALEEMYAGLFAGSGNGMASSDNAPNEPENESPVQDQMDAYVMDIKDGIVQQYEVSPDEALDKVFEVADQFDEEGQLPPMPDDDSSDEEVTEWLAAARSIGFAAAVMTSAEEEANESPEEEEIGPEIEEGVSNLLAYLQTEGYELPSDLTVEALIDCIAVTPELAWLLEDTDYQNLTEGLLKSIKAGAKKAVAGLALAGVLSGAGAAVTHQQGHSSSSVATNVQHAAQHSQQAPGLMQRLGQDAIKSGHANTYVRSAELPDSKRSHGWMGHEAMSGLKK